MAHSERSIRDPLAKTAGRAAGSTGALPRRYPAIGTPPLTLSAFGSAVENALSEWWDRQPGPGLVVG